jgi:hypothetical protein
LPIRRGSALMYLGQLVVRKVNGFKTLVAQLAEHLRHIGAAIDLDAHQNPGLDRVGKTRAQLGDVAAAKRGAQLPETAHCFGNGHSQQSLALRADFCTVHHVAQAVKIHAPADAHVFVA